MKRKILLLMMFFQMHNCFCQNIKHGTYLSKNGSSLKITADGTFDYSKEFHQYTNDVYIQKKIEQSYGKYEIKNGLLVLNTEERYIDSIIDKSIRFVEIEDSKTKDSINITVKKNDFIKVYLCKTGLELKYDIEDYTSSFFLSKNRIKVPKFYANYLSIKIYPNMDNYYMRSGLSDIKRICFESKKFIRNDSNKDLFIEIDFNVFNFYYVELNDEIVLIENDKLKFRGEEYILKI